MMVEPCYIKSETDTNEVLECLRFINEVLREQKVPIYFGITINESDGMQLIYYSEK